MVSALYYVATAMALTTLQASVLHGTTNFQLEMYRQRNHVMLELLIKDGCKVLPSTRQRAVREIDHFDIQLRAEKILYEDLTDQLISCKAAAQNKVAPTSKPTTKPALTPTSRTTEQTSQTSTSTTTKPTTSKPSSAKTKLTTQMPTTTPTITTTKPTTTTTTSTTTPFYPQPPQCQSASNLTEYWRKDHNGTGINFGNANCDNAHMVDEGRPWFRFSGDAGTKLLDHCINSQYSHTSCGTHRAIWSDASMPTKIGPIISIPVYGSYNGNCKAWERTCSVMRCSSKPSDFIYRYDGEGSGCSNGFCGMD